MIKIRPLDLEDYIAKTYHFAYITPGYYDLQVNDMAFQFIYKAFDRPKACFFDDELVGEWLEHPILFGAFDNDQLLGFIEGSMEGWNQRFRISNILLFEEARNKHIGTSLMKHMILHAQQCHARMVILETQSCNIPAIHFYKTLGFEIIGFDTCAYSNEDVEKHEVRIEMGLKLSM